jgi:hypothetical protein
MLLTIPFAGISAIVESLFGLQSLTILAFIVLITLELLTGLIGAKVLNKRIDFFGDVAYQLLNWLHGTLFIYINIEYLISVLENLGTISGREHDSIIDVIKDKLKSFITKN